MAKNELDKINEALDGLKKNGKEKTILFKLLSKHAQADRPDEKDVNILLDVYSDWSKNWR